MLPDICTHTHIHLVLPYSTNVSFCLFERSTKTGVEHLIENRQATPDLTEEFVCVSYPANFFPCETDPVLIWLGNAMLLPRLRPKFKHTLPKWSAVILIRRLDAKQQLILLSVGCWPTSLSLFFPSGRQDGPKSRSFTWEPVLNAVEEAEAKTG
jgi:hypothetical protein